MAGISKGYNLSFDYVLYKMSFANIRMYNAVLPTLPKKKDDEKSVGEIVINGDDPANSELVKSAMFDVNEDE